MEKILYALQKNKEKYKKENFQLWLNKKINSDTNSLEYKDVVLSYIAEIKDFLKNNNYQIKNNKQFKDEIASYIYSESNQLP